MLSPAFSDTLRSTIATDHATPSSEVKGRPVPVESRQTTHFSVTDDHGNAVALTTTINGWYGSAVTVAGAGFLLNNEMDDFAAKPGTANQYGLVQGEANAIAPGKRMLSAMTPTIVLDADQRPLLVTGASGGPFIITTVFQAISNRLDYGLGASALMQAPRLHHQHLPDALRLEQDGFAAADIAELKRLGHEVRVLLAPRRRQHRRHHRAQGRTLVRAVRPAHHRSGQGLLELRPTPNRTTLGRHRPERRDQHGDAGEAPAATARRSRNAVGLMPT